MIDHPVKRALERDVLPYLVSAKRLRRQWFYLLQLLFGYTTDLVAALAAIGISMPFLVLLEAISDPSGASGRPPMATTTMAAFPRWLLYPSLVLIVLWVFLRVVFNREDGQKRAVLAKSCTRTMRQAEAKLPDALRRPDPIPALNEIMEKHIRPTIDRNIQEDAWPWTPFAPSIEAEVAKEVNALCLRYESDWAPPPPLGMRGPS